MTTDLLESAIRASLLAGGEILKVYETDFSVETKKDNSPLTLADKNAHKIISQILLQTGIPVLSEEGKEIPFDERKNWNRLWIVDPLDGTKEFVKRNGEFTVNIALVENQKPILGVIYAPVKKVLYYATAEFGAYKSVSPELNKGINDLLKHSFQLPLKRSSNKFTLIASRSHLTDETKQFIQKLKSEHGEIDIISAGSSLKICLVAEGIADVYPRFGPTMEWDTAAGQAIAECAGKSFIDVVANRPMLYNKKMLFNNSFIVK